MLSDRVYSTLNLFFAIIGYQFATCLAMPIYGGDIMGATNKVTIPYRLFTMLLATIVIVRSFILQKNLTFNLNRTIKLLTFFWALWILRLFYDLEIRFDFDILPDETSRVWMYVFLLCLYSAFSIAVSFDKIDLHLAFRLTAFAITICLLISLIYNPLLLANTEEIMMRVDGNAALGTIAFGQMGLTAIIIGACMMRTEHHTFLKYIIPVFLISVGSLITLRAGSRGPLLSLCCVVAFVIITSNKKPLLGFFLAFLFISFLNFFLRDIIMMIANVAPVLAERLINTSSDDGRTILYQEAIKSFLQHPFFGDRFAIIYSDKTFIYSHNMILDAFMGTGILGGIIFIAMYVSVIMDGYKLIKSDRKKYMWIVLILIQQMAAGMTSSAFYLKPILTILIIFLALSSIDDRLKKKTIKKKYKYETESLPL
ncbi:MAG: O-antigen ligase family protein [Bacteroidales bacterium]|nr:O-antigen ligase family protein [Bacteroidales bacterium]